MTASALPSSTARGTGADEAISDAMDAQVEAEQADDEDGDEGAVTAQ
jgi:hypothetical protein